MRQPWNGVTTALNSGVRVGLLAAALLGHKEFAQELTSAMDLQGLKHADGYVQLLVGEVHRLVMHFAQDPAVFSKVGTQTLRDLAGRISDRPTFMQVRGLIAAELGRRPQQAVLGNRPRLVPGFVVREELNSVRRALATDGSASLCAIEGMRGVGKSQIASAFAEECERAQWELVAWVSAVNREQTVEQLARWAKTATLATADATPEETAIRWVEWVSGLPGDRLIVFDNLELVDDLDGLVPRGPGMRILATTTTRTAALGTPVEVGVFAKDQAVNYLIAATDLTDRDGAALVANDLGYLPVALTQAATTIKLLRYDVAAYRKRLNDGFEKAVRRGDGDPYPVQVDAALRLAYQEVLASSRDEVAAVGRAVLYAVSLLAETGVPRDWAYHAAADEDTGREAIGELVSRSVLVESDDRTHISLHRLQSRVIRDDATAADDTVTAVAAAVRVLDVPDIKENRDFHTQRGVCQTLGNQLLAVHEQPGSQPLLDDTRFLAIAATTARHANKLGYPYLAIALGIYLVDRVRVLGSDHPKTLSSRNSLAYAYRAVGDHVRALALYERAFADRVRVLGFDHPDTLISRNSLADAYRAVGRAAEADALFD